MVEWYGNYLGEINIIIPHTYYSKTMYSIPSLLYVSKSSTMCGCLSIWQIVASRFKSAKSGEKKNGDWDSAVLLFLVHGQQPWRYGYAMINCQYLPDRLIYQLYTLETHGYETPQCASFKSLGIIVCPVNFNHKELLSPTITMGKLGWTKTKKVIHARGPKEHQSNNHPVNISS